MSKRKPSPQPLSIRAYARRRGVSHQAVMKAIATGRLAQSLERNNGGVKIADPDLADREWAGNTDLSRAHDAVKTRAAAPIAPLLQQGARAMKAFTRPAEPDPSERDPDPLYGDAPGTVAQVLEPQPHGGALLRRQVISDDDGEGEDGPTLADWSAKEKEWRAKTAELKFRKAAGELLDAGHVRLLLTEVFTRCRSKLLGLPNKTKSRLPHLTLEDVDTLDAIVREVCEELVNPVAEDAA